MFSFFGLSSKASKLIAFIGIPVLIIALFYMALTFYGNSRYNAGKEASDQAWKDASAKLEYDALAAGTKADEAAALRTQDYNDKLLEEKEKIDEAISTGNSPLDVLFAPNGS